MKTILKFLAAIFVLCSSFTFSYAYYAHVNGPGSTCPDSELKYYYDDNMPDGRVRFTITNGKIFNVVSSTWETTWEFRQSDNPNWNNTYPFRIKWDNLPLGTVGNVNVRVCQGWCVEGDRSVTFNPSPLTAIIAGGTSILNCQNQQQTYTATSIPENWHLTGWDVSSYLQQITSNLNQVTVAGTNTTYNGMQTLTGTFQFTTGGNSCGTQNVTKNIWLGKPAPAAQTVDGFSYYSGYMICPGNHWVGITWNGLVSTTSWSVTSGIYYSTTNNECDFTLPSTGYSSVAITVNASNVCGTSYNASYYLPKKGYGCGGFMVAAYPNPATSELNVQTTEGIETDGMDNQLVADEIILLDKEQSKLIYEIPTSSMTKIETLMIPPGEYYLHVRFGNEIIKKHVIIRR